MWDLPSPGIEPGSPELQADSLPAELWGKLFTSPGDLCNPGIQYWSLGLQVDSFFFFFFNNRTILLNIWTYLFCTTHISFFPLPQEASALEPRVYKNTLWQLLWQGEKSAILKVTTHNQSGEQKKGRGEWAQCCSSSLKRTEPPGKPKTDFMNCEMRYSWSPGTLWLLLKENVKAEPSFQPPKYLAEADNTIIYIGEAQHGIQRL